MTLALLSLCLFLPWQCRADIDALDPDLAGHWAGDAPIIVTWCKQPKLALSLDLHPDGSVTGSVGDATLKGGRLRYNRGWLGRRMQLKTDYIITGDLEGAVVAAESITRSGVDIPLNFDGISLSGGLHTSGRKLGGKAAMKLSASPLQLKRRAEPGG